MRYFPVTNPDNISEVLRKYDKSFLDVFSIIFDVKMYKKSDKTVILLDCSETLHDIAINDEVYIVTSLQELTSVLDFFYNNVSLLEG